MELAAIALASGAQNLIEIVTPEPATFGLTAGEIASYTTLASDFADRLAIATAPITRTPVALDNKNIAKRALKAASVNIARTIIALPSVTNAQLISLESTSGSFRSRGRCRRFRR